MENKREIYVVSVDGDVSYTKGNGALYLHSLMSQYDKLEPYIRNNRGVYVLIGQGKAYIGEGDVFSRLTKHKHTKHWVEDVYVYLTDKMMTKEDSLQYEGAFEKYIKTYTDYTIQNKVRVRDNEIEVGQHIQVFTWLGLTVNEPRVYHIENRHGEEVFTVVKTVNNTVKIKKTHNEGLGWLTGLEFKSLNDVQVMAETLNVGGH